MRRGALGRVRVVRDHHDRLAVLAVQRLEQVEDLVAGLAIEVAGRLVAQQQRRIGDDRAGDPDALLLAARQLPRIVPGAVGEPDDLERGRHVLRAARVFDSFVSSSGSSTFSLGRQHRQQVVELEDEADVAARATARAGCRRAS